MPRFDKIYQGYLYMEIFSSNFDRWLSFQTQPIWLYLKVGVVVRKGTWKTKAMGLAVYFQLLGTGSVTENYRLFISPRPVTRSNICSWWEVQQKIL